MKQAHFIITKELLARCLHLPGYANVVSVEDAGRDVRITVESPDIPEADEPHRARPEFVRYDPPVQLKDWGIRPWRCADAIAGYP